MPRIGFAIDNRACIGCHACTVACKSEHDVPIGVNRTWVKYIEKGEFPHNRRFFSVQRCNHCEDAPCVEICPVTSLFKRPDGIVDFDSDRCIGCKACMQACPYDALYLDPVTHTAAKCNYCTHRVDQGIEPACVVICPVEAIVSGDLDDPSGRLARLDREQRVQYPKPEKNTRPKLFYVGNDAASLDPTQAPPRADYLWSADAGVSPKTLKLAEEEAGDRARRVYDARIKPTPWGWMVSAYVTTKAISAGTALIAFVMFVFGVQTRWLTHAEALVALGFLGLTGALLVADLKKPTRFVYVLLRPQWKSWLVRGAYAISAFSILLLVGWGLSAFTSEFDWGVKAQRRVGALAALISLVVAAYTALLFAQARGRDYWQNPLLVVSMTWDAVVAGVCAMALIGLTDFQGGLVGMQAQVWLILTAIPLPLLLAIEFLPQHATRGAALAAEMMTRGAFRGWFWGGVIGLGIVAPFVLILMDAVGAGAILLLGGIAIRNHLIVQAPQHVPLR
ncbi:MAG: polysulfide reductase NrfD [Phycisphaerales bacterium]|nr:polysulfide reductase NrfD [Phycisphaerales bacterium]